jgi:hypothetical protein
MKRTKCSKVVYVPSKVTYIFDRVHLVTVSGTYTRALTFENLCGERRLEDGSHDVIYYVIL